ncbi:Hypothetical predicted protein, partial [Xyrichtys novacula]
LTCRMAADNTLPVLLESSTVHERSSFRGEEEGGQSDPEKFTGTLSGCSSTAARGHYIDFEVAELLRSAPSHILITAGLCTWKNSDQCDTKWGPPAAALTASPTGGSR